MRRIEVRLTDKRVCELWFVDGLIESHLATEGAYGMKHSGWHSHHGSVRGDWCDIEDVVNAYHITLEERLTRIIN